MIVPTGATGPAGITGATGPTGPAGSVTLFNAYGGISNNTAINIPLTANTPTAMTFPNATSGKNVLYTPVNSITVQEAGDYYIDYSAFPLVSGAANITVSIRANGVNIDATTTLFNVPYAFLGINYAGSTIVTLPANAVVDMGILSDTDVSLEFDEAISFFNLLKVG